MPDREKNKRAAPISYRPPKELRAEFRARQRRSGLSVNAFITKAIFDAPAPRRRRRPPVVHGELARLLGLAARIHERLDEIAPDEDPDCAPSETLQEVRDELAAIRASLMDAIGRRP